MCEVTVVFKKPVRDYLNFVLSCQKQPLEGVYTVAIPGQQYVVTCYIWL